MKSVKLSVALSLVLAAFALSSVAQEVTLPEVTVTSRNYKYLRSIDNKNTAQPVKLLERKAAAYDIRNSEYYEDDYDTYFITFYLPNGYVLATYDEAGKLIRTAEKFNDVTLPSVVRKAVADRYPNWSISKDVYLVKYNDESGANMNYKLLLQNGNKRLRVKLNEKGEFLD